VVVSNICDVVDLGRVVGYALLPIEDLGSVFPRALP
jgi:hypothetical protein